jgi:hypothetical protein
LRNDFAATSLSLVSAPGKICRLNGKDVTNEYHESTNCVRSIEHSRLSTGMFRAQQDAFQHTSMRRFPSGGAGHGGLPPGASADYFV